MTKILFEKVNSKWELKKPFYRFQHMRNENQQHKLSKFLSFVLRHNPQRIGISLDLQGWTSIPILLEKMNAHGKKLDRETLEFLVATNNKQRYAINEATNQIRANQGHSIPIDLGYQPQRPPTTLYHGTAQQFIESIFKTGLEKRNRHHVHLSADLDTASKVGQRHGKLVILEILTKEMNQDGYDFFLSENGVWLTEEVPVKYIRQI